MYHFAPTTPVQQQLQEQQQQEDLLDFFIPFDQAQAQAQPQPQPQQPATLLANDWLFQPPTLLQYDASMVSPPTPQGDRTATNRTLDEEPTTTTTATAAVAAVYEPSRDVFGNWSLLSSDHQFGLNFDKDYQGLLEPNHAPWLVRRHSVDTATHSSSSSTSASLAPEHRPSLPDLYPNDNNKKKRRREEEEEEEEEENYPEITKVDLEAARQDPSAIPRRQKLRYEGDNYTPKWVRYTGQLKEGYCDSCRPGKWLQLKNSAYWYHKQFFHGISSVSGKRFLDPLEQRPGEHDVIEGLCHQCRQYVPICNAKRKTSVLWYRHAHKCHIYDKPKPSKSSSSNSQAKRKH